MARSFRIYELFSALNKVCNVGCYMIHASFEDMVDNITHDRLSRVSRLGRISVASIAGVVVLEWLGVRFEMVFKMMFCLCLGFRLSFWSKFTHVLTLISCLSMWVVRLTVHLVILVLRGGSARLLFERSVLQTE